MPRRGISAAGFFTQQHSERKHHMGLDSYAYITTSPEPNGPNEAEDFFYWRKRHDLNDWALKLAEKKGQKIDRIEEYANFDVQLEPPDIDELEALIKSDALYGAKCSTPWQRYYRLCDRDFIAKARRAFEAGLYVFFASDW
jgi:hypothetical protein